MQKSNTICLYSVLDLKALISGGKDVFFISQYRERIFQMGDLFPPFRGTEEGLRILALPISQVASFQNNWCVIIVYFRGPALGHPTSTVL